MEIGSREVDEAVLAEADALLHARITEIERLANVSVEKNHSHSGAVIPYQPEGVELAAKVAADLGLSNKEVMTLAGHEYTTDEEIVAGLAMLTAVTG